MKRAAAIINQLFVLLLSSTCEAGDGASEVTLLMPDTPIELNFGDPLFVPIAIENPSNKRVEVADLRRRDPDLRIVIQSGDSHCELHANQSFGGGTRMSLPPKTAQSVVLMVNVWSPGFAVNFLETKEGRLRLEFGTRGKRRSKDVFHQPMPPLGQHTVQVAKAGTSFTLRADTEYGKLARRLVDQGRDRGDAESPYKYGSTKMPHTFHLTPFHNANTPLSWLTSIDNRRSWFNNDGQLVNERRPEIKQSSRLYRLLEFSVIHEQLRESKSVDEWNVTMQLWHELFRKCNPIEAEYYTGELAREAIQSYPMPVHCSEFMASMRNRYPLYAAFFTGEGSCARISIMH